METTTKRAKRPTLSTTGEHALAQYEQRLRLEEDLTDVTIRNYLSDLRDRAIIVLLLHTGLRARELCTLTRAQVRIGKRSETIAVLGKHNKHREIPLNATARTALLAYDPLLCKLSQDTMPLFLSKKKHTRLTERGLGYMIKKYAEKAQIRDISPHDLRYRFGYRMAATVPLHRFAQLMGHDSLDTTMIYVQATRNDLQQDIESIAWR